MRSFEEHDRELRGGQDEHTFRPLAQQIRSNSVSVQQVELDKTRRPSESEALDWRRKKSSSTGAGQPAALELSEGRVNAPSTPSRLKTSIQALPKTPEAPETTTFMTDWMLLEKEGSGRVMVECELAQAAEACRSRIDLCPGSRSTAPISLVLPHRDGRGTVSKT